MTEVPLKSLPEEEQDAIMGRVDPDYEEYWDEWESEREEFGPDFNPNDCGGVFDGFGVISDADPGL
jgi:hypothetical protein